MIKGTTNNTRCDARCWNAKGTTCHCSCGGKAHGTQPALFADPNDIAIQLGTVVIGFGIEDTEGELSTHDRITSFPVLLVK